MIRFLLVAFTIIFFLILSVVPLGIEFLVGKSDPHKRDLQCFHLIQKVFRFILRLSGTTVSVRGLEHIPKDQAVLYVGNHSSYFDILIGYCNVPGLTGFVAKKEMKKIPLLSTWMSLVHCLFLDRENIKEGLKTILIGIEKVKSGISIWIFPEGTRNKDGEQMMPFKEGSLKIAEKSGCLVIPVAISGTADIFENHFPYIRKKHVILEFGEPILLKELDKEHKKFSGAYTRELIQGMLDKQKSAS